MSKYKNTGSLGEKAWSAIMLTAIANEFAEANRLKRYQLLKIYGINNKGEDIPTPELEEAK